jgi:hypothetical protein
MSSLRQFKVPFLEWPGVIRDKVYEESILLTKPWEGSVHIPTNQYSP